MKHTAVIFCIICFSLIISCRKQGLAPIHGRWLMSGARTEIFIKNKLTETIINRYTPGSYMDFHYDGIFHSFSGTEHSYGIYRVQRDSLVFDECRSGKIHFLTDSSLSYTFHIYISPTERAIATAVYRK